MNLQPFNSKFRARYYRVGHDDSVAILADSMRSRTGREFGLLSKKVHIVDLFLGEERVANIRLQPGESVLLFDPLKGIVDTASESPILDGNTITTRAGSWFKKKLEPKTIEWSNGIDGPFKIGTDTLYGRTCTGRPITDREVAGEPAFIKTDRTTYTVPPNVGQNIEVPNGSVITTYDPKARGL